MNDARIEGSTRYRETEEAVWRETWLTEARRGHIWVPYAVTDKWCQTLCMWLLRFREGAVTLYIDTAQGYGESFRVCQIVNQRRKVNGLKTSTVVVGKAHSIGLSYAVCGTHRTAMPDAEFLAHGEYRKSAQKHESGVDIEDYYTADWLRRYTKQPYEFWLDLVQDGKEHTFGVKEALEWGVIDEVLEGV